MEFGGRLRRPRAVHRRLPCEWAGRVSFEARRRSSRGDVSGVVSLGGSTCCVEESSSCGENDLDKENNNMCFMSKTRRRRSDDGNELTAKTCWRER